MQRSPKSVTIYHFLNNFILSEKVIESHDSISLLYCRNIILFSLRLSMLASDESDPTDLIEL